MSMFLFMSENKLWCVRSSRKVACVRMGYLSSCAAKQEDIGARVILNKCEANTKVNETSVLRYCGHKEGTKSQTDEEVV